MDVLMVLIVIVGIITSVANKKKTAQGRKGASSPEKGTPASGSSPARQAQQRSASAREATATTKAPTLSKTPSAPGTSKWPWPTQGNAQPQKKPSAPAYSGTPRYTHVVTSTLEGGHTHTESSMTGEEECPPPHQEAHKAAAAAETPAPKADGMLSYQPNDVLRGILYAEILGKPKALQRQ